MAMFLAVQNHIARASLSDIEFQVRTTIGHLEKFSQFLKPKYESINLLLNEILNESLKTFVNYSHVQALGQFVNFHLVKPSWWYDTRLCFEYKSDMPGKFCSGTTPSCAKINHYTSTFKDWSRSSGGCSLSWNINTSLTEPNHWLRHVKLCYMYKPITKRDSCKIGSEVDYCTDFTEGIASIPTKPYYDHSDNNKGGCYLTWKLTVPNEIAPTWFLNTKFCVKFEVGSKTLPHYGKSKAKEYCAYVNRYTMFYQDRTYFRTHWDYRENFVQWGIFEGLWQWNDISSSLVSNNWQV